jgi:hypothetical protein
MTRGWRLEVNPQIARLRLDLTNRYLRARIEVHALEETAIPLPIDVQQWVPQQVMIDDVWNCRHCSAPRLHACGPRLQRDSISYCCRD